MKKLRLLFLSLFLLMIGGCASDRQDADSINNESETELPIQTNDIERFKLFPTQNMWTFIKLDTQTGQMWQVQYSLKSEKERFEYDLNSHSLVTNGKKVNGRFELYPTQNIYNFILLDRIDGQVWQVQWSFDAENRLIVPVEHAASPN